MFCNYASKCSAATERQFCQSVVGFVLRNCRVFFLKFDPFFWLCKRTLDPSHPRRTHPLPSRPCRAPTWSTRPGFSVKMSSIMIIICKYQHYFIGMSYMFLISAIHIIKASLFLRLGIQIFLIVITSLFLRLDILIAKHYSANNRLFILI